MGILTPTNSPFCNAGPTESTVFPSAIPTPIATRIHTTRKRSRKDRPFNGGNCFDASCSPGRNISYLIRQTTQCDVECLPVAGASELCSLPFSTSPSRDRESLSVTIALRSIVFIFSVRATWSFLACAVQPRILSYMVSGRSSNQRWAVTDRCQGALWRRRMVSKLGLRSCDDDLTITTFRISFLFGASPKTYLRRSYPTILQR
jgi:hypothetical protein